MDYTLKKDRAKWSSLESVSNFGWSGSALLGGAIIDHGGRVLAPCEVGQVRRRHLTPPHARSRRATPSVAEDPAAGAIYSDTTQCPRAMGS